MSDEESVEVVVRDFEQWWGKQWIDDSAIKHTAASAWKAAKQADHSEVILDKVEQDCDELREIAEWFDGAGKDTNGKFLRDVASRYEVVAGAYSARVRQPAETTGDTER